MDERVDVEKPPWVTDHGRIGAPRRPTSPPPTVVPVLFPSLTPPSKCRYRHMSGDLVYRSPVKVDTGIDTTQMWVCRTLGRGPVPDVVAGPYNETSESPTSVRPPWVSFVSG